MAMKQSLLMLHCESTRPENLEAGSPPSQQFNGISYRKVNLEVLPFNYIIITMFLKG
jgi:hypothetical protein